MKKTKNNKIVKAAIVAVLFVGLFSAAYIGIKNLAFVAATEKMQGIPLVATNVHSTPIETKEAMATNETVGTEETTGTNETTETTGTTGAKETTEIVKTGETVPPDNFKPPELTVYLSLQQSRNVGANAMSPEEAAQLGAQYIWDVLGESIDGKTVEMIYTALPSFTKTYWHGTVADSKTDLDITDTKNYAPLFSFMVCAVSGERIDIEDWRTVGTWQSYTDSDNVSGKEHIQNVRTAFLSLSPEEVAKLEEMRKLSNVQSQEVIDECAQAASNFAAKHFVGTEVVSVEFKNDRSASFDLDENGNIVIVPAEVLYFTVTDSTGREADVAIGAKSKELRNISTQYNDIVPGSDVPGGSVG